MKTAEERYEAQAKLIYSMIVAGKSANFADKVTRRFLEEAAKIVGISPGKILPFDLMFALTEPQIEQAARAARTGNYTKLARACAELVKKITIENMDLFTCTPSDLESVHGIGRKTSRFFIMWIRPEEEFAALDVHVLRWMRALGYAAPKATPSSPKLYEELEKAFIAEAHKMGKTARELDEEIWQAGANRTQTTPLPGL